MRRVFLIVGIVLSVLVTAVLIGGGALVVNALEDAWEDGVNVREIGVDGAVHRYVVDELDLNEWGREPCPDCRERDCDGGYDCDRYDRYD